MSEKSFTESYYNSFYTDMARVDAESNGFAKIIDVLPDYKMSTRFLDIGCGYGSVTDQLVESGYDVTAVEINENAIEVLAKKGFTISRQDINQRVVLDSNFDVIFLLDILEHVFDPGALLENSKALLHAEGCIITSVPLYFDLLDRLKILVTGSVISLDNLCYGDSIYQKIKSYNYDHIRFMTVDDVFELASQCQLEPIVIKYIPTRYHGKSRLIRLLVKIVANKFTATRFPKLFAHQVVVRWIKKNESRYYS